MSSRMLPLHHSDLLTLRATDIPGPSGANHRYVIEGFDIATNPAVIECDRRMYAVPKLVLLYQNGHPIEVGVNGITMEAVITSVIDRLIGFQRGNNPSLENVEIIAHFQKGLELLNRRSDARVEKVELGPLPGTD